MMNSSMAGLANYQSFSFSGYHSPLPLFLTLEISQLFDVMYLKGGAAISTAQLTHFSFQTAFKRIYVSEMGVVSNSVHIAMKDGAFIQV